MTRFNRPVRKKLKINKLVISSPNTASNALRALANKLSEKVGYRVYRVTPDRVKRRIPVNFCSGIDKLVQFDKFKTAGVSSPNHSRTNNFNGFSFKRIVARTLTNSSEGRGIKIFEKDDPNPPYAPLYTEYIPKKKEFRVHVWNNEVIHVAEKRKRKSHAGEADNLVRNTANGYVFCTSDINEPSDLRGLAAQAVRAIGRCYGAVDVIWNEKLNKCFVLEVNSRPGMEGTTVEKYADAILRGMQRAL